MTGPVQARPVAAPGSRRDQLLLAAILALAALLRLPGLDRTSLWYDEAVSWSQSSLPFGAMVAAVAGDNYPPLHNILLWAAIRLFGDGEVVLRLPSALASILAVWLLYRLGRSLFGPATGLLAAFLLALSPFQVWYAGEARMYALFAACGLAFLWAAAEALRRPCRRAFWLATLAAALFLYCHIYAAFSIAGVGLLALVLIALRWRDGLPEGLAPRGPDCLLAALAAAGVLFLPWLVLLVGRARHVAAEGFWIAYPDAAFLTVMAGEIAGSGTYAAVLAGLVGIWPILATVRRRSGRTPECLRTESGAWQVGLLAAFAGAPVLLGYGLSIAVRPILFDRYLIAAASVFLLMAAAAATRLAPRAGALALAAASLALIAAPLHHTLAEKPRPEWRAVAEIFRANRTGSESLILYKGMAEPPLRYYLRAPGEIVALPRPADLAEALAGRDRAFLLIAHTDRPEMIELLALAAADFEQTGSWRRFGWGDSGLTLLMLTRRSG
ncbi:glycosyltransferase family 39 protein [Polymorphum gilvum]|uniref:Glycosyltransferase RgtA/B/C/D-like domain-containing protein n=1 Tax=Polymorphum gilvum (strain LMG 25793 / CGMCC 1.9160 / SL003B-26A1) TaxID=991905 RepID=F2J1H1_POLGS|nr:glycosyltransferase family 39 protein [Polymorphum gilvum]ADZ69753.1 hypothetical protein SL003B_1325 [Polymorphum gilvum SL003B-26A1]